MEDAPRKRRLIGEINVVPMIDVMLVLLVIFMATAPLLTQGVQVELPQASAAPLPPKTQRSPPLIVAIDRQGLRFLNISRDAERALEEEELRTAVEAALMADPQRDVLLQADRRVAYEHVMSTMVLLQSAGAARLGFLADPPPREGRRQP
jgi:biopolymer transport protein TolR